MLSYTAPYVRVRACAWLACVVWRAVRADGTPAG